MLCRGKKAGLSLLPRGQERRVPIQEVALDHLQQGRLTLQGESQNHGIYRQSSLTSQIGVTHPGEHRACQRGSAGGRRCGCAVQWDAGEPRVGQLVL